MDKYQSFNKLMFSDYEHPTSFKINQILNLVEYVRLSGGPYSISLDEQFDLSIRIKLNEDVTEIGGLTLDGIYTNRRFNIYYETKETTSGDYACWTNVRFDTNLGYLSATVISGANIYSNEVDISNVDSDALNCIRCSGA